MKKLLIPITLMFIFEGGNKPRNFYGCMQHCMYILDLVSLDDAPECVNYVKYMKRTIDTTIEHYKKPLGNLPWLDKELKGATE